MSFCATRFVQMCCAACCVSERAGLWWPRGMRTLLVYPARSIFGYHRTCGVRVFDEITSHHQCFSNPDSTCLTKCARPLFGNLWGSMYNDLPPYRDDRRNSHTDFHTLLSTLLSR